MLLSVYVHTGSTQERVVELDKDTLEVWVRAPAREGKANERVLRVLADTFGVALSRVVITRGLSTRIKHIEILGFSSDESIDSSL